MKDPKQEIDKRIEESLCEDCLYEDRCSYKKENVKSCRHYLPRPKFDKELMEWLE